MVVVVASRRHRPQLTRFRRPPQRAGDRTAWRAIARAVQVLGFLAAAGRGVAGLEAARLAAARATGRGVFGTGFGPRLGAGLKEGRRVDLAAFGVARSEEHTSELQSQSNLVCRLLLE